MMLSSGPFTMAPGDTQTVVIAVIVGQGKDRLTSITALKFNDLFAQKAFDANFDLPAAPPLPASRSARSTTRSSLLGRRLGANYDEPGYEFEGYNVYMGESVAGPWKRITTYDVNNNVGPSSTPFRSEHRVVIDQPVQFGADTGGAAPPHHERSMPGRTSATASRTSSA